MTDICLPSILGKIKFSKLKRCHHRANVPTFTMAIDCDNSTCSYTTITGCEIKFNTTNFQYHAIGFVDNGWL